MQISVSSARPSVIRIALAALLLALTAHTFIGGAFIDDALAQEVKSEDAKSKAAAPTASAIAVVRVSGNEVNLRSGPSIDYHAVGQAARDDLLLRVGVEGEFIRARVPGGPIVYVFESLVSWEEGALRGTVTAEDVLMRATPSQAYYPVHDQKLRRGDELIVLGAEETRDGNGAKGRWYKVIAPERIHVWLHGRYAQDTRLRPHSDAVTIARHTRLDALTGGRTKAERERIEETRRDAVVARLDTIAAALSAGTCTAAQASEAAELAKGEPVPELAQRALDLQTSVTRAVTERAAAAESARIAGMKAESEAAKRAQEQREAEHRRKLEEIERRKKQAGRGDPTVVGVVRVRGPRVWIETNKAAVYDLRSVRFRLADYADKKVRVWGSVTKRPDTRDRVEVDSIEVITR